MLYFTIFGQNKYEESIQTHSGTGDERDGNLSVSKQLTIMYKYSIYEEFVCWEDLSSQMSEDEFNKLFEKGQRLFWLETFNSRFIVKIEDWDKVDDFYKKFEQDKINSELLDSLKCWSSNFVNGFFNLDEFKRMVKILEDFDKDNDKKIFDIKITQIEDEIDRRQNV